MRIYSKAIHGRTKYIEKRAHKRYSKKAAIIHGKWIKASVIPEVKKEFQKRINE